MSNQFAGTVVLFDDDGLIEFVDRLTEVPTLEVFYTAVDPNGLIAPQGSFASGPAGFFINLNGAGLWGPVSTGTTTVFLDNVFKIESHLDASRSVNFDLTGPVGPMQGTFQGNFTASHTWTLPDFTGTLPIVQSGTGFVFLNQSAQDNGSNAGIQYRSDVANRAQLKVSQYGNNAGVPGVSTIKSRGTIGVLAPVLVGDVIWGVTAVGVTSNLSIPLSGLERILVESVPAGQGYIGTGYELQLVPNSGPANGRKQVFYVNGNGVVRNRESLPAAAGLTGWMAGVVTLDAAGQVVVPNTQMNANSRVQLTAQDGGAVPTGTPFLLSRVNGTSLTIASTAGAGDAGVKVYYQLYEPTQ